MEEPTEQLAQVSLDARNLRGIAHPLRVRILGILRTDGPATASMLARRLDVNTGATSYHLRQLAEHGFITEVPARGARRERWWQAAHANTVVPDNELLTDRQGLGPVFLESLARVWADSMLRAVEATPTLPPAWRDAQDFGDYMFNLTPDEAKHLMAELHEVLKRHHRTDAGAADADSARVTFQFQLFPNPEDQRHPQDENHPEDQHQRISPTAPETE
ncbi:helix-turn-helix domain-containing protein [Kitasatospora sp. NBC_01287]|uniref:ArsR/SmtB family transcription factor n=1 Tax=Kitasatospora sp. NBC_01287 TaxID=2903573 RepID=UPI0022571ECF|nr:helix-turn-helix domain-containing protein [Kitasatospora sp. NBC_01287]MCX4744328.1 helix-turn-helix domain-containing protein [Kitasatospora sp. NBC_01287]